MMGFSGFKELVTKTELEFWANTVEPISKLMLQNRIAIFLFVNCCFMLHFLLSNTRANFPVSRVEQNFTCERSGVNKDPRLRGEDNHRRAKVPVRKIPPVLAGIRAGKHQNLTFPCDWRAQWLLRLLAPYCEIWGAFTYRCGGSTRLVFPV